MSLNSVQIMGNLTRDPEVKQLESGSSLAKLTLAVNDNSKEEEVSFVNVTMFGKSAETLGKYVKKGRKIVVEGRLKEGRWEKDGQKFSKLEVIGDRFHFVDSGKKSEDGEKKEVVSEQSSEEGLPF